MGSVSKGYLEEKVLELCHEGRTYVCQEHKGRQREGLPDTEQDINQGSGA